MHNSNSIEKSCRHIITWRMKSNRINWPLVYFFTRLGGCNVKLRILHIIFFAQSRGWGNVYMISLSKHASSSQVVPKPDRIVIFWESSNNRSLNSYIHKSNSPLMKTFCYSFIYYSLMAQSVVIIMSLHMALRFRW